MRSPLYIYPLYFHATRVNWLVLRDIGGSLRKNIFDQNDFPFSFSMKLRKHINNKRLEKISQMGVDRVIDIQVRWQSLYLL